MELMYKYFYKFPKDHENEYQKRLESPNLEVLDLKIKPYKHNKYFNLYYVPTSEIINLVSSIEKNN
ncbi:Fic family protein, partial [Staphylococcus capitis subsp. urealyticus]